MNNSSLIKRFFNGLMIPGMVFGALLVFSGVAQVNATADQNIISLPVQTHPESVLEISLFKPTDRSVSVYDGGKSAFYPTSSPASEVYHADPLDSLTRDQPIEGAVPAVAEISVSPAEINSTQFKELVTLPLSISSMGNEALDWQLFEGEVSWSDNFDSYPTGSQLHEQGGWSGWENDVAAGAFSSDDQARSTPNSVDIFGDSDLIHPYSGITSGVWVFTAWQYIPSDFVGTSYFILLNTYTDGGTDTNWSTQVIFSSYSDELLNEGPAGGTLPLIKGEWVEIRDVIDLDADTQTFYYGGEILFTGSWTEGMSGGGALNLASVNLLANWASSIYYDDLSLSQIMDIPWLSIDPTSGSTVPGETSNVDVILDATGLDFGLYTCTLFVSSNDPFHPMNEIPVTLRVDTFLYIPFMQK